MKDRVFNLGERRYVWFESRPVFKVRFKPDALALWMAFFDELDAASTADEKFFEDRIGVEFDVYSWDTHPTADTWFYAIDDSDRSLPVILFDSFQPELHNS